MDSLSFDISRTDQERGFLGSPGIWPLFGSIELMGIFLICIVQDFEEGALLVFSKTQEYK